MQATVHNYGIELLLLQAKWDIKNFNVPMFLWQYIDGTIYTR